MPVPFAQYFDAVAKAETRSITIFEEGHSSGLPPGEYGFVEYYCNEKKCHCNRVHFLVVARWAKEPLAMVAYGWESPSYYKKWMLHADKKMAAGMSGVSLEPLFKQSTYAHAAKRLVEEVLLADPSYVERLKRHNQMMRDYVDGGKRAARASRKKKKEAPKKTCPMIPPKKRIAIPELVSTETVRQALLSPHEAVRISASSFFTHRRADNRSAEIMKTIIQSIELYGKLASLGALETLEVPQDETTVRWLTQELEKKYDLNTIPLDNYCYLLSEIVSKIDPEFLTPDMASLPCFDAEFKPLLFRRIELAKTEGERLWKMLLETRLEYDTDWSDDYLALSREELLVEAVARHCLYNQRVLDWLQKKDVPLNAADWEDFTSILLQIVAKNRLLEAREFVFAGIREAAGGYISEGYDLAFVRVAEDDDWEFLYSCWKESPKQYRWFPFLLTTDPPSKKQLEIALDMLQITNDNIPYYDLMVFLLDNYVKESHPIIAKNLENRMVSAAGWDTLAVKLVVSAIINSDSLDDFDDWFGTAEEIEWDLEKRWVHYTEKRLREVYALSDDDFDDDDDMDGYDDDVERASGTVDFNAGRNSPCPCGSGKKYKMCCLKK